MKLISASDCVAHKVNGLYVLDMPACAVLQDGNTTFKITVDKGGMTDGLSIPKFLQKIYLPCWDDDNSLYNLAGVLHDGAYGSEVLSKSKADEMFYTILICAGIPKWKAKMARFAVENFAGLHYGKKNDDFGISEYVSLEVL